MQIKIIIFTAKKYGCQKLLLAVSILVICPDYSD